jgi:hypothetical protein
MISDIQSILHWIPSLVATLPVLVKSEIVRRASEVCAAVVGTSLAPAASNVASKLPLCAFALPSLWRKPQHNLLCTFSLSHHRHSASPRHPHSFHCIPAPCRATSPATPTKHCTASVARHGVCGYCPFEKRQRLIPQASHQPRVSERRPRHSDRPTHTPDRMRR